MTNGKPTVGQDAVHTVAHQAMRWKRRSSSQFPRGFQFHVCSRDRVPLEFTPELRQKTHRRHHPLSRTASAGRAKPETVTYPPANCATAPPVSFGVRSRPCVCPKNAYKPYWLPCAAPKPKKSTQQPGTHARIPPFRRCRVLYLQEPGTLGGNPPSASNCTNLKPPSSSRRRARSLTRASNVCCTASGLCRERAGHSRRSKRSASK